ncbi:MAG: diadenylate cyclase [Thermodesulfobacteriota bacterium]
MKEEISKFFEFLIAFFKQIGFAGFFDIAFMSLLIYSVLLWFKKTRAGFVLSGIIIMSIIYLLARQFNLVLIYSVLQGFFAVIIIALIVIFQEELRRLFERIAVLGLNPRFNKGSKSTDYPREVQILLKTLSDFANNRVGALIVLPGRDIIDLHLEGGVELNGDLSEPLLKSIFDPHSIGHDGAVIIENGKITMFSVHLPLSRNFQQLRYHGTRHAAALGLSEFTDALCLVVSEERGTISVARNGILKQVGFEQLSLILHKFYEDIHPPSKTAVLNDFLVKHFKEKVIAVILTVALWFVLVYGSGLEYESFLVPIQTAPLQSEYKISEVEPKEVKVTFLGPRRSFFLTSENEISLILNLPNATAGLKTVTISDSNLNFPKGLTVEKIEPPRVKVKVDKITD